MRVTQNELNKIGLEQKQSVSRIRAQVRLTIESAHVERTRGTQSAEIWKVLSEPTQTPTSRRLDMGQLLGQPLDTHSEVVTAQHVHSAMACLAEGSLGTAGRDDIQRVLEKIQTGIMLCESDAKDTLAQKAGVREMRLLQQSAEALVVDKNAEKVANHVRAVLQNSAPLLAGMNVEAFVQAVLRESYLLQYETLKDYGRRLQATNDLRKGLRAQLEKARQLKLNFQSTGQLPASLPYLDKDGVEKNYYSVFPPPWGQPSIDDTTAAVSGAALSATSVTAEIPPEWKERFAPATAPDTSVWQAFLNALRVDPSRSASKAFREFFGATLRSISNTQIYDDCDALVAEINSITEDDFAFVCRSTLSTIQDELSSKGNIRLRKSADIVLSSLLKNATPGQLLAFKNSTTPEEWSFVEAALGRCSIVKVSDLDEKLMVCDEKRAALPKALQSEDLRSLVDFYLLLGSGYTNVLPALQYRLRSAPAETAQRFLKGICDHGADAALVSALLFACSYDKLFSSPDAQAWKFLENTPGTVSEFFGAWKIETTSTPDPQISTAPQVVPTASAPESISAPGETLEDQKKYLDAYIQKLEQDIQTADGDSQLASYDLQNALQSQQQTLQLMSNMSKMLHETAMSIIRKIGG